MISVNVFSEERAWSKRLKNKDLFFKNVCNALPRKYKFSNKKVSLSLLLSNNKNIKKLNKVFRKKNKATDVLSFPFYKREELKKIIRLNKNIYLGDIILNHYKIKNSSKENFKKDFDRLWVHGLLHLIGYRHSQNKDFNKMNKLETNILTKF